MRALAFAMVLATPVVAEPPRFVDLTATLPVEHVYQGGWEHFVGGGVTVFDCNADGRPEFLAAGGTTPARLFRNETPAPGNDLRFALAEFPDIVGVTGAYALDIDSDGWRDLVILRVGPNIVLRGGLDCTFRDVTKEWGLDAADRWSTAFSATWEVGQAFPTLAIGNYVDRTDPEGPFEACDVNELHRPEGRKYKKATLLEPGFCALSLLFSDWQRRGAADLRVSNDRHYYVRSGSEQMWRLNPLRLLGKDDGWDRISIWGMGIASEDLTGDGRPEIVLTSMGDQLMKIATATGYTPAPFAIGTYAQRPYLGDDGRPSTGWHAEFADVNNDGLSDLFIAKGNVDQMQSNAMEDPNNLLIQEPDGTFFEAGELAGIASMVRSRGAALADFDGDGLRDLVVVNRRAPLELYQNRTENTENWIALEPRQEGINTFAVGAWIEMKQGSGIRTREITVGGGHAGGTAGPLHLGLGKAGKVAVRVIWPDGAASGWKTLNAGSSYELWRGVGGALETRIGG